MKLAMAIIEAWNNATLREKAVSRNLELVRSKAEWNANMRVVRDLFGQLTESR
jgi:hypothetical protein